MRSFTDEEYDTIIRELTCSDRACYDKLCEVVTRQLYGYIRAKCAGSRLLTAYYSADDLMNDVIVRVIKTCMYGFFFQGDRQTVNRDPDGFCKWLYTVASNEIYDKIRYFYIRNGCGSDEEPPEEDEGFTAAQEDRLADAFNIVLESDSRIYIILTWLAQTLFVIRFNITKISSQEALVNIFSDKTLFRLWEFIQESADRIMWIIFTARQVGTVESALYEEYRDGVVYGDVIYSTFFTASGGGASVSDWVGRMNRTIERMSKYETSRN